MIEKYCQDAGGSDRWHSCYVRCDSPGCDTRFHIGELWGWNGRTSDVDGRCRASSLGWSTDVSHEAESRTEVCWTWERATQDFCPDCTERRESLAGRPSRLTRSLGEVKKQIATWPGWFREHVAQQGLLFLDLPAPEPGPGRLYDLDDRLT